MLSVTLNDNTIVYETTMCNVQIDDSAGTTNCVELC